MTGDEVPESDEVAPVDGRARSTEDAGRRDGASESRDTSESPGALEIPDASAGPGASAGPDTSEGPDASPHEPAPIHEPSASSTGRAAGDPRRLIAAPFITGLLAGLGLIVAYAAYLSISTIMTTLMVLAISIIIAVGLDPVVGAMTRRGMRRAGAVAITYLAFLAVIVAAFYAIIPPIATQISSLIKALPGWLNGLLSDPTIKSLDDRFGVIERAQSFATSLGTGAASGVMTAAGIAVDLFIVLVLSLYFLAGLPRITESAYRLVPASRRDRVREIGTKIIRNIGGYLGGTTLVALQAGIVAGLFAWIVGLPYPFAIATGAFALDFVPVVGPVVIGVSMAIIGFTQSVTIGIVAGAFYLGQHLFEAYWLSPRVMRRAVHISTAAVIVAIVIGVALLGIVGAVLAVPVAAAVQLIVREVLLPRQEQH